MRLTDCMDGPQLCEEIKQLLYSICRANYLEIKPLPRCVCKQHEKPRAIFGMSDRSKFLSSIVYYLVVKSAYGTKRATNIGALSKNRHFTVPTLEMLSIADLLHDIGLYIINFQCLCWNNSKLVSY